MISTVAEILRSIEALPLREQQEIVMALCDRVVIDEPLETSLGVDSIFRNLDLAAKRDVLLQKLLSGLEQIKQGRVVDGEIVFDRLQAKLRQMSEQ